MENESSGTEQKTVLWVLVEKALDWYQVLGVFDSREKAMKELELPASSVNPVFLLQRTLNSFAENALWGEKVR